MADKVVSVIPACKIFEFDLAHAIIVLERGNDVVQT
jgi:hypothetical protein